MSKRLLASARANRGRSLRPRASLPRVSGAPEAPASSTRDSAHPVASGPDVVAGPAAALSAAPAHAVDTDAGTRAAPLDAEVSAAPRGGDAPAAPPVAQALAAPPVPEAPAALPIAEVPAAPQVPRASAASSGAGDAAPVKARDSEASVASQRAAADDRPAAAASEADEPAPDSDALDLIDPSSPTAAFFRREEESFPPLTDVASDPDDHADERLVVVHQLSPETLARRARLRRIVAGVAGLAGVISVAVVAKSVLSSKPSSAAPVAMAAPASKPAPVEAKLSALAANPAPAREKAPPPAEPAPAQGAAKVAEAAAEKAAAEKAEAEKAAAEKAEAEKADAEKAAAAEEAEAEKAEAAAVSLEDAGKLKKEALSFLNRGRYKDAIEASRAAIAADPTDALPYLYLGSALQDTGKWKDGIAAYSDCVRNATKGPIHECRAMGGRK
ncbi:hypothetical protein [Sorangium sp. So ce176]|uniref:hypothetical protein n=1 Tax=Sorangium sp. So ce176 TaxID=3133286 RepID=UPI003F5E3D25